MSSHSNVYISGLPDGLDDDSFRQLFEGYGSIKSVKLFAQNRYGFVKFETVEEAQNVVDELNGSTVGDHTLIVKFANNDQGAGGKGGAQGYAGGGGKQPWAPVQAQALAIPTPIKLAPVAPGGKGKGRESMPSDQVYIKGLPLEFLDEQLFDVFSAYGNVVWHKVMRKPGVPDSAALVQMSTEAEARWLVEHLNGNIPQGLTEPVHVSFCTRAGMQKGGGGKGKGKMEARYAPYDAARGGGTVPKAAPAVRWEEAAPAVRWEEAAPANRWEEAVSRAATVAQGGFSGDDASNLYVKGLPTTTDELYLYKLFAPFGAITSVRPIVQDWGAIGFVKYVQASDAQVAIANLSGQTLADGSEIQVSIKTPKHR